MPLSETVSEAVEWARGSGDRKGALAELAVSLAGEIESPNVGEKGAPPIAALAKELRATLLELEGLRDGDDAATSLGLVLSSPVWDSKESEPANARPTRRKDQRKSS